MKSTIKLNFFTVYLTDQGVELYEGCEDYPFHQVLHTSKSYELAYQFAQNAAAHRNLPIRDRIGAAVPQLEEVS